MSDQICLKQIAIDPFCPAKKTFASQMGANKIQAVQFDMQAMESASQAIAALHKSICGGAGMRILGSELLTNLLRGTSNSSSIKREAGKLYKNLDYSSGEFIWYLEQNGHCETVNDKDYIIQFPNGDVMVVSEDYFNLRFMHTVAGGCSNAHACAPSAPVLDE